MMEIKRVVEWDGSDGRRLAVRIGLSPVLTAALRDTGRRDLQIEAEVDGRVVGYGIHRHRVGAYVAIAGGRIGLTAERLAEVEAPVAQVEADRQDKAAWQRHNAALDAREAHEAQTRRIERLAANGRL